jgi:septal ring factor EnvC (AmiA/AmiB activator)
LSAAAQSDKKDKLKRQKVRLEDEIQLANKILAETRQSQTLSLENVETVNQKLKLRQNLIRTVDREVRLLNKDISVTNAEIDTLQKRIETLKKDYANMIVQANKSKNKYSRLMFILSSQDFNQALKRIEYMKQYSNFRRRQVEEILEEQNTLSEKIEELNIQKNKKAALKAQMEREKNTLIAEKKEQEDAITELRKKEGEVAKDVKAKQKKAKKLENEIQRIIAAEIKRAREKAIRRQIEEEATLVGLNKGKDYSKKTSNKALKSLIEKRKKELSARNEPVAASSSPSFSLTPEAKKLAASFTANKSRLPWPVQRGIVISKFGPQRHKIAKSVVVNNNGVDIATEKGSKARAVFDGEVLSVFAIPGSGNALIIKHGNYFTVYQNLAEIFVKTGDKIQSKQEVALIYSDKKSNQTKLHFEIWKDTDIVDPLPWLARR